MKAKINGFELEGTPDEFIEFFINKRFLVNHQKETKSERLPQFSNDSSPSDIYSQEIQNSKDGLHLISDDLDRRNPTKSASNDFGEDKTPDTHSQIKKEIDKDFLPRYKPSKNLKNIKKSINRLRSLR